MFPGGFYVAVEPDSFAVYSGFMFRGCWLVALAVLGPVSFHPLRLPRLIGEGEWRRKESVPDEEPVDVHGC